VDLENPFTDPLFEPREDELGMLGKVWDEGNCSDEIAPSSEREEESACTLAEGASLNPSACPRKQQTPAIGLICFAIRGRGTFTSNRSRRENPRKREVLELENAHFRVE
jgi:hypothetical protein